MQKLKLVYFGSPSFSADFLEKIIHDKTLPIEIISVVTQPDKPVGRKQILTPSPVKVVANKYGIELLPDSDIFSTWGIKGVPTGVKNSTVGNKVDIALVYAYGEIIPKEILSLPKYGFWNIHPSLLPLYRGASPIAYPLILGDKETGVSLMVMDEKMDKGPLLAQEKMEILPTDSRMDLEIKLTNYAFNIFKKQINTLSLAKNADFLPDHLCDNELVTPSNSLTLVRNKKYMFKLKNQNHAHATYTYRFKKSDGFISFETLKKMVKNEKITIEELPAFLQTYLTKYIKSSQELNLILNSKFLPAGRHGLILNLFRGLSPWPGIWTLINVKNHKVRLKITEVKLINDKPTITKVQLEGKKEVDLTTFNQFYKIL